MIYLNTNMHNRVQINNGLVCQCDELRGDHSCGLMTYRSGPVDRGGTEPKD